MLPSFTSEDDGPPVEISYISYLNPTAPEAEKTQTIKPSASTPISISPASSPILLPLNLSGQEVEIKYTYSSDDDYLLPSTKYLVSAITPPQPTPIELEPTESSIEPMYEIPLTAEPFSTPQPTPAFPKLLPANPEAPTQPALKQPTLQPVFDNTQRPALDNPQPAFEYVQPAMPFALQQQFPTVPPIFASKPMIVVMGQQVQTYYSVVLQSELQFPASVQCQPILMCHYQPPMPQTVVINAKSKPVSHASLWGCFINPGSCFTCMTGK